MAGNNSSDLLFVKQLIADYPEFRFCLNAKRFSFRMPKTQLSAPLKTHTANQPKLPTTRPPKPTIFIGPPQPFFALQTLHELGHALKAHQDYTTHVDRLKIERAAWETAKTVYKKYQKRAESNQKLAESDQEVAESDQKLANILPEWDDDYVESCLDTYRDWLHAKSKCKKCGLTCYQTKDGLYHCPRCENFI